VTSGDFEREQEPSVSHPDWQEHLNTLARRWAGSGAMWLTGRPDGPALGCPAGVVEVLDAASQQFAENSKHLGTEVSVDGLALLGERAALSSLSRRGSTSCGGATRLLQTVDGFLALSLARPDDVTLLSALLGHSSEELGLATSKPLADDDQPTDTFWSLLAESMRYRNANELVERGAELGMAIAALPIGASRDRSALLLGSDQASSTNNQASERLRQAVLRSPRSRSQFTRNTSSEHRPARVVDLSSLWAGPLCGQLLASAGCEVVKVESTHRPDGARMGSNEFFSLLNGQKQSVRLDFTNNEDVRALIALLRSADVVIEASRPRALEQLGVVREFLMATSAISVWLQITGHGATGPDANRIGFGDDAAIAAGLVAWDSHQPVFCADAIADPATGLVAASAVIEALGTHQQWLLDVSLRRVAEAMAWGPTLRWTGDVAAPKARVAKHEQHQKCLA
jgi:CoA-transferase family III